MPMKPSQAASAGKGASKRRKKEPKVQLNAMMDLMTVILLFLIKSYSTSGAMVQQSEFVDLATSAQEMEPKKAVGLLLNLNGVFKDNPEAIVPIGDVSELNDEDATILPTLESYLIEQREFKRSIGAVFKGEVTIQCDKAVKYDWLLKVMNTCGQTEFATIDFLIIKN